MKIHFTEKILVNQKILKSFDYCQIFKVQISTFERILLWDLRLIINAKFNKKKLNASFFDFVIWFWLSTFLIFNKFGNTFHY